jgi:adenylate kinase
MLLFVYSNSLHIFATASFLLIPKKNYMFNFIIFGPPGSGKGTQSAKIAEKYNLAHISTGDIFRKNIKEKTELGLKVKSIIDSGELVPDELLIDILDDAINSFSGVNGFIFDGFPRTIRQADEFEELLKGKNQEVSLVLALRVDDEEIISRLLKRAEEQGRLDDTREVIENRLKVYRKQTEPLIEYYKNKGKFESVHGIGTIDEIFESICRVIDRYL